MLWLRGDYVFVMLQISMNVLELVTKIATVLTHWVHSDVTVMTDTDYEWNLQPGSVKVTQHLHIKY